MDRFRLPKECSEQWGVLVELIALEEMKIDRTSENEINTMNYFYKNEGVRKILLEWLKQMKEAYAKNKSDTDTAQKSDELALLWRQRGNDKFHDDDVAESYNCYCQSILFANQDGPMYPLAVANRAAALLRMKKFEDCLSDIALAIESGYPSHQRQKLYLRKADCLIQMGRRRPAELALKEAKEQMDALKISPPGVAEFQHQVRLLEKKLDVMAEKPDEEEDQLPTCFMGENLHFPSASNALELSRSERQGRYVRTRQALRRGDVLFSELPYAWVTLPTGTYTCESCCCVADSFVPCTVCSRSVFCSTMCRMAGQHFHRWECEGVQSKLFSSIGIAHLALRVVLVAAAEGFPQLPWNMRRPRTAAELFRNYKALDNVQVYAPGHQPFFRMFHLVTNFDKMNSFEYTQYALTAMLLTLYLENFTSFFEYLPGRMPYPTMNDTQNRLFIAAMMLRAIGQLICNGHATLGLQVVEDGADRTQTEQEVRRATAIYPSAAMMNHSCDPNIIYTFYKNRLIVRCARELAAGAEVTNCYGPHMARASTQQRRDLLLAQYYFLCMCSACVDTDKPDYAYLYAAFSCQSCRGPVLTGGPTHAGGPTQAGTTQAGATQAGATQAGATQAGAPVPDDSEAGLAQKRLRCSVCNADFPVTQAKFILEQANELDEKAKRAATAGARCKYAAEALRLRQQVWHRHHAALRRCADRLARFYADAGEFSKSIELIKSNIQTLEYQYGSFSVEVANELRKLVGVMTERISTSPRIAEYRDWCLETHNIMRKAIQLLEFNYGPWEPLVKRLREQEAILAAQLAESNPPEGASGLHMKLHYNLKI